MCFFILYFLNVFKFGEFTVSGTSQMSSFPKNGCFTTNRKQSRLLPHQNQGHSQSSETVSLWYSKCSPGSWRQSGQISGTFFHLGTPVSVFDLYIQYLTFLLPFYCGLTLGKLCHAFMNLSLAPFRRFHRLILSIPTILHQICRVVHIHECFISHVIFSAGFFMFCAPTFFKIGHLKPKNDLNSEAFLNVWFSFNWIFH